MTNNADNNSKPLLRQFAILLNESLLFIIQIPCFFCCYSVVFLSILFIPFAIYLRVYLGVKLGSIMLISLFHVTGEFYRFLHRG